VKRGLLILLIALFAILLSANDGGDRYNKTGYNLLMLFPDSPQDQVGYRVLSADAQGGADGEREFRWASPQAIALIRIAAANTYKKYGAGDYAMAIFDASSENGDTPVNFSSSSLPRGRHPGGSHDGGLNIDLGYYLTSMQGIHYSPDYAACSNHFLDAIDEKTGKPQDANLCLGAADRLDVLRQSYFLLQIFKINRDLFERDLLEEIGMDLQIQTPILQQIQAWIKSNENEASSDLLEDMQHIFTADAFEGWAKFHHHHLHLRLRDVSTFGKYRLAFQSLYNQEREADIFWAANRQNEKPIVRSRLYSANMKRYVDVELINLALGSEIGFRINQGEWIAPEAASRDKIRAALGLPSNLLGKDKSVMVEAKYAAAGQKENIVSVEITEPKLAAHLFVKIDKANIKASYKKENDQWVLNLEYPEVYNTYITGIACNVFRFGTKEIVKQIQPNKSNYQITFKEKPTTDPIQLINISLVLSSRLVMDIPVYSE
jgi:hypothetical protein